MCLSHRKSKRTKIASYVIVYGALCLIGNASNYLSAIFAKSKLLNELSIVLEATLTMIGFYVSRLVIVTIIARMYSPTESTPPKWYIYFLNSITSFMVLMTALFYALVFILENEEWKYIFYLILSVAIFILSTFSAYIFGNLLKRLNRVNVHEANERDILFAKRAMRIAIVSAVIIDIISVMLIFCSIEVATMFIPLSFNKTLNNLILHSALQGWLVFVLIVMNYKKSVYPIREDTVCGACCRRSKNVHKEANDALRNENTFVVLQESAGTNTATEGMNYKHPSININQENTITSYDSQTLTLQTVDGDVHQHVLRTDGGRKINKLQKLAGHEVSDGIQQQLLVTGYH